MNLLYFDIIIIIIIIKDWLQACEWRIICVFVCFRSYIYLYYVTDHLIRKKLVRRHQQLLWTNCLGTILRTYIQNDHCI